MKQADLHLGFQVDKAATAPEQPPGEPESCISLLSNGTDLTSSNAIVLKMRGIDSEICCPARSIYTARHLQSSSSPQLFKRSESH